MIEGDLKDTLDKFGVTKVFEYTITYFLEHLLCILQGNAGIMLDIDGIWCSICEKEIFQIAMEEQKE